MDNIADCFNNIIYCIVVPTFIHVTCALQLVFIIYVGVYSIRM